MLITEFPHREIDGSACGPEADSLHAPGGILAGPWALRPKRLRWLTTSAANRQASPPGALKRQSDVDPGQDHCAPLGTNMRRVDTVRSEALEDLSFMPQNAAPGTGLRPFLFQNSDEIEVPDRASPPLFLSVHTA